MPAARNGIKAALAEGRVQIGAWLNLAATSAAEIAGQAGFDWCLVDAEHGASDLPLVRDQLIALASVGCPAAVRVPVGETWVLKQALDAGAQTLLVPMVDDGAAALRVARACRYPPAGNRGLAAGVVRASGYGADPGYMHDANDQVCLMVQAESRAAVDNIDAIAATEGVDCVFVGPSDLAADMGHMGDTGHRDVVDAIGHVMARTQAAGKAVGMFCLSPAEVPRWVDAGARFLAVASDVAALRTGLSAAAGDVRQRLG